MTTFNDAYTVMLQEDIIAIIANATHITVIDAMSFYYQWRSHSDSK